MKNKMNLLPCPFCGKVPSMTYRTPMTIIWCMDCNVEMSYGDYYECGDSKKMAIKNWNRRVETNE